MMAAAAGRDPIPVTNFGTAPNREAIGELIELGIHRAVMRLPSAPADVVLPLLDRQAELIEAFS